MLMCKKYKQGDNYQTDFESLIPLSVITNSKPNIYN